MTTSGLTMRHEDATCTEPGMIYTDVQEVQRLRRQLTRLILKPQAIGQVIPAPGHKYVETELVAANCNHSGVAVNKCSECGKYELVNDNAAFQQY